MADKEKLKAAIKGAVAVGVCDLFVELGVLPFDSPARKELQRREQDIIRVITEGTLRALQTSLEIEIQDVSLEDALAAARDIFSEQAVKDQLPAKL